MNTPRLALALGIAAIFTSAGFIACSNDDSAVNPGPDASDDAPRRDTSSGQDTGAYDAGTEDAAEDAPPGTDPGQVTCGTATCNVPGEFCCVPPASSDAGANCQDASAGICRGGNRVDCDEAIDCARDGGGQAQVCCNRPVRTGVTSTCGSARNCQFTSGREACKTDSDCPDAGGTAGTCVTQTCRGRTIRSCGGLPADDAGVPEGC